MIPKRIKPLLRKVRDNAVINTAVITPFRALRQAGVPVPKKIYQHLLFEGPVTIPCGDSSFRMYAERSRTANVVYWGGLEAVEPECVRPWEIACRHADVVLDVGANVGLFALMATCFAPHADVHAFEPLPRLAARVERNALLNSPRMMQVHPVAVGAASGSAKLHDPGGSIPFSSSLLSDFLEQDTEAIDVDVVSIDEFVSAHGLGRIGAAKIDVEGFESEVLRGMRETIARDRPTILFEYLPRTRTPELEVEIEFVAGLDYVYAHLTEDGVVQATVPEPPSGGLRNAALIPTERWGSFRDA